MAEVIEVGLYFDKEKLKSMFGLMGNGGVVSITTRSGPDTGLLSNRINIPGLQRKWVKTDQKLRADVDFRPQIYWQGEIETDEKGHCKVTFPHTQDFGRFRIEVVVQDISGKMGSASKTYMVDR